MTKSIGSLSKEFPLAQYDATIRAIRPGMTLDQLRRFAAANTHSAIPALLGHRLLLLDAQGRIVYDCFLSLVANEGINSRRVRKLMYLVWTLRDPRVAGFINKVVADRTGKWRVNQLLRKANEKFFRQFFEPRTAPKVRSNIEYFLVEAGIFDPRAGVVHLELGDGWLGEAMQVAAQHEKDPARRRAMVNSPGDFLISEGLNGLANATPDELRGQVISVPGESEPLEDSEIEPTPARVSPGRSWNRPRPSKTGRPSSVALIDAVARERANDAHWMLEKAMSNAAAALGYDPKQHNQIDIYFVASSGRVLAEIKSCVQGNFHSQVRKGVSQLFEYRFRFKDLIGGNDPTMVLVTEIPPSTNQNWLVEYLESLGILIAWKDQDTDRLISKSPIPQSLCGIVFPAA